MIAEGFIAMSWAGAAMGTVNSGLATNENLFKQAAVVVGIIAQDMLGGVGGMVAVLGVIVLAITSGDTALRALRLMIGDALHIDQRKKSNAFTLAFMIFAIVALVLYYAKTDKSGFMMLWRYFSWANETIAVFAFAMIAVYMIRNNMPYLMAVIPGTFYMYMVSTYILHAKIGLGLEWTISYVLAAVCAALYAVAIVKFGNSTTSTRRVR
jgi:carbon starvation protein CstA